MRECTSLISFCSSRSGIAFLAAAASLWAWATSARAAETGQEAMLPDASGLETVEAYCTACHSIRLVLAQRMTREGWDDAISRMMKERGMPATGEEERRAILDELARELGLGQRPEEPSPFFRPPPLGPAP